jgi:hypothetical protein
VPHAIPCIPQVLADLRDHRCILHKVICHSSSGELPTRGLTSSFQAMVTAEIFLQDMMV